MIQNSNDALRLLTLTVVIALRIRTPRVVEDPSGPSVILSFLSSIHDPCIVR